MSKPRIVHMVEAYEKVGGPPRLVRLLASSSLQEKYEFHILSHNVSGFDLKAVIGVRRSILELEPDCVHVHGLKSDGFLATLAATLAGISPVIVTVHGSTRDAVADYAGFPAGIRKWIVGRLLEPATLTMADAVYCVCDAMTNQPRIRCHAGSRLRETIHNGVQVAPVRHTTSALRRLFGFAPDDVVVLYCGRIALDKGLRVLAQAAEAIFARSATGAEGSAGVARLLLAGDGPAFAEVEQSFKKDIEAGRVVMAGRRDDIEQLNAMADIIVLPSYRENLPFSILEAMNAGRPVVATRVGGIPEVVIDGKTGLLVEPDDAGALAAAIRRLAADCNLRREMGRAGHELLSKSFSADTVIRKTGRLYESVLSPAEESKVASVPISHSATGEFCWPANGKASLGKGFSHVSHGRHRTYVQGAAESCQVPEEFCEREK